MVTSVDLNCDLGEGCGNDAELMQYISSANVACGFHAGDETTMRQTVALALEHGVAIGAHPGYRDRENFGRTELSLPRHEVRRLILDQLELLNAECERLGAKIRHVKPHGALYNQAAKDIDLAHMIAEAVAEFDPDLTLFGSSGSSLISEAQAVGLKTASEVFADRTYRSDATLTPRTQADALISDTESSLTQVLNMIKYGRVRSTDSIMVPINAQTICIHGDGPNAVNFARSIRERLIAEGITVEAPDSAR